MQIIADALNSINYSLTHPTGWEIASVVISAISLILTVAVLIYNHKSISLAQKSIAQAVDLQLYEKRLELYKRLQDRNAFAEVPMEIKIVYSNQIYNLYLEISELCQMRGKKLIELATVDVKTDWKHESYNNVCEEVIQLIDEILNRYMKSGLLNEKKINSLKNLRNIVFDYTEKIKMKRTLLQEKMEKELKDSFGNGE